MPVFVLAALLLTVTSVVGASTLKLAFPVSFLLAAYLFAAAQIVLLTELLSQFDAVGRAGYLAGQGVVSLIATALWLRCARPRPPRPKFEFDAARRHPLVLVLAVVVGLSLLYGAALGVATPPSNWDSMTYHLSRVAAWHQTGAVEYVTTHTERQNSFPPNAEIEILYTVTFIGRDTPAAAPQFLAKLALLVGITGASRRIGFTRPSALFAALVFASLTLVALQSVTTQNDLIVASFVVAATYFILDRRCLPLAGIAIGLAIGAKATALLALPMLALLALVQLRETRRRVQLTAFALAGVVFFGAYGYSLNLAETGDPLGTRTETDELRPEIGAAPTAEDCGSDLVPICRPLGLRRESGIARAFRGRGKRGVRRSRPARQSSRRDGHGLQLCHQRGVPRGHLVLRTARTAPFSSVGRRLYGRLGTSADPSDKRRLSGRTSSGDRRTGTRELVQPVDGASSSSGGRARSTAGRVGLWASGVDWPRHSSRGRDARLRTLVQRRQTGRPRSE